MKHAQGQLRVERSRANARSGLGRGELNWSRRGVVEDGVREVGVRRATRGANSGEKQHGGAVGSDQGCDQVGYVLVLDRQLHRHALHQETVVDSDLGISSLAGREGTVYDSGRVGGRAQRAAVQSSATQEINARVDIGIDPVATGVGDIVPARIRTEDQRIGAADGLSGEGDMEGSIRSSTGWIRRHGDWIE